MPCCVCRCSDTVNVWRIPKAIAETAGYNVTPPSPSQLFSDPNFTLANLGPVMATKYFAPGTGPGAANDPTDGTTYSFADGVAGGQTIFTDGKQFYYFAIYSSRRPRKGWLGFPGVLMQACRKVPPAAPTGVRVQKHDPVHDKPATPPDFLSCKTQIPPIK